MVQPDVAPLQSSCSWPTQQDWTLVSRTPGAAMAAVARVRTEIEKNMISEVGGCCLCGWLM